MINLGSFAVLYAGFVLAMSVVAPGWAVSTDLSKRVEKPVREAMEALLVEAEYGSTIEVYQQTLELDNAPSLVNVFRLSRISLFYQTLDRKQCGFHDVAAADWSPLPAAFKRSIQTAIEKSCCLSNESLGQKSAGPSESILFENSRTKT